MIVVGIDPHTKSHTAVAVSPATGELLDQLTVTSDRRGRTRLLAWAQSLDERRLFAVEDCRHITGGLERHLLTSGERVVRVPPKLMAGARRQARTYGKSDAIDAAAVARAALRESRLPEALPAGPRDDLRLLCDHRDDLVCERRRIQKRLRWHLHDLEVDLAVPPRVLDRYVWLDRIETALRALPASLRRRIAAEQVQRCRELTRQIRALESEIRAAVAELAPQLCELPGCAALTAASLVGRVGGVTRFAGEAAFAMHSGTAPLAVSSGRIDRHRLNRRGDRRLNATIHIIAVTQARMHPPAIAYLERKRCEGKSTREALRCLKRHIARTVYKMMLRVEQASREDVALT
jgi:transposase